LKLKKAPKYPNPTVGKKEAQRARLSQVSWETPFKTADEHKQRKQELEPDVENEAVLRSSPCRILEAYQNKPKKVLGW
jgi:hypothetical protein